MIARLVVGMAVVTALIKASGPVALGGRALPSWASAIVGALAPALLTALVVVETFADGKHLSVDAGRTVGLAAAAATIALRLPILVTIVAAAGAAAAVRAVS